MAVIRSPGVVVDVRDCAVQADVLTWVLNSGYFTSAGTPALRERMRMLAASAMRRSPVA